MLRAVGVTELLVPCWHRENVIAAAVVVREMETATLQRGSRERIGHNLDTRC